MLVLLHCFMGFVFLVSRSLVFGLLFICLCIGVFVCGFWFVVGGVRAAVALFGLDGGVVKSFVLWILVLCFLFEVWFWFLCCGLGFDLGLW